MLLELRWLWTHSLATQTWEWNKHWTWIWNQTICSICKCRSNTKVHVNMPDRGAQSILCESSITHRKCNPLWPQANGEVAWQNCSMLKALKITHAQAKNYWKKLNTYLWFTSNSFIYCFVSVIVIKETFDDKLFTTTSSVKYMCLCLYVFMCLPLMVILVVVEGVAWSNDSENDAIWF